MKKQQKILLGVLLVFGFISADAQTANQLGIGAKAGYNFNQFSQPGTASGVQAGGYARFSLSSFLSFQVEALYDLQGGGRTDYSRDSDFFIPGQYTDTGYPVYQVAYSSRQVDLQTISVPLSVRLSPGGSSNMSLNVVLGGSFDYILNAREVFDAIYYFESGNSVMMSDATENISGDLGDYQISAHVGAALDFILDDGKVITYEMRYRKSFTDLNETVTAKADLTESLYSSTFSLSLYYQIF